MRRTTRLGLASSLILMVVGLVAWLSSGNDDNAASPSDVPPPDVSRFGPLALDSSAACEACHAEVFQEWNASHHRLSWINPEPRRKELSDNFRNKDCIPCHAPRPMLEVGFGRRPLERETHREDGVDCFTCHRYQNGIATPNALSAAAAGAPCNPVTWEPMGTMTLCAPCHDQHKVLQDWKRSRFAQGPEEGRKDCNDCHMPETPGPGTKGGSRATHRNHLLGGGHDPDQLVRSATLRARVVGAEEDLSRAATELTGRTLELGREGFERERLMLVEIKNTGVGHNFPSDERHRAVDLVALWLPEGGAPGTEATLARFRNPYRNEFEMVNPFEKVAGKIVAQNVEWDGDTRRSHQVRLLPEFNPDREIFYPQSTQLAAGESRLVWFRPFGTGKGRYRLRVYYKLNPYMSNGDAVICNEVEVEVDAAR